MRYLKEGLKSEEHIKKARGRPKPSTSALKQREVAEVNPQQGNVPRKFKPQPKAGNPGEARGEGRTQKTRR